VNPYTRRACADETALADQPTGQLRPYWMGRDDGFIGAAQ
jgi:hypothetical protein